MTPVGDTEHKGVVDPPPGVDLGLARHSYSPEISHTRPALPKKKTFRGLIISVCREHNTRLIGHFSHCKPNKDFTLRGPSAERFPADARNKADRFWMHSIWRGCCVNVAFPLKLNPSPSLSGRRGLSTIKSCLSSLALSCKICEAPPANQARSCITARTRAQATAKKKKKAGDRH